jgi:hypothetical protein
VGISTDAVGTALPAVRSTIERGRLRFFAVATGVADSRYTDLEAARAAGYPDLPVPPTFLFGLKLDSPDAFAWLVGLGVDLRRVLHGSQRFDYSRMAFAGDVVDLRPRITDVYEKRGGQLEFVVVDTAVSRGDESIATLTETIVVRHPTPGAAA